MNDQCCGNCHFWLKRTDHAGEGGGGYCRRYPPIHPGAGFVATKGGAHARTTWSIQAEARVLNDGWPYVHQQSWCGEWQQDWSPE